MENSENIGYGKRNDNIFLPPGGILLWIIITLEISTFLIACAFFLIEKGKSPQIFIEMQMKLSSGIGTVNTIALLTSGYFMALSVSACRSENRKNTLLYLQTAVFFGLIFLVLKSFEYSSKISAGLTLEYHIFFTFYWLLTVFHFAHVLLGVLILTIIYFKIRLMNRVSDYLENLQSGAVFWHMCDLIWVFLFPTLYLIR